MKLLWSKISKIRVSTETLNKIGYKNVVYDTPRYGEMVAIGIKESSGDILAFLEDDDEFKSEKLAKIYNIFSSHKDISYFHDTREFIYKDKVIDYYIKIMKENLINFQEFFL